VQISLGPMLREARLRAGLKRADLARRAGIDPGYLMRIENGKHDPPFSTVVRLAAAVGLSLDRITSGDAIGVPSLEPDRAKLFALVERHLVQAQATLRKISDADIVAPPVKLAKRTSKAARSK
jgi:transcriptional regulator with XRE-family HTH domain